MRAIKSPLTAALLLAVLSGCDADVLTTTAVAADQSAERAEQLSIARQKGMTEQTPLLPLVVSVARELVTRSEDTQVYAAECNLGLHIDERPAIIEQIRSLDVDPASIPKEGHAYSRLAHGSVDELNAGCNAYILQSSTNPISGWAGGFNDPKNHQFARALYSLGLQGEAIAAPIVKVLSTKAGYTVEELRQFARAEFVAKASEIRPLVVEASTRVQQMPLDNFHLDFSGQHPSPVHFTVPSEGVDVSADGFGTKLVRDGVELFGAGYIQGTRYAAETLRVSTPVN